MSVRTVDAHVAAVLDKLGVRTRRQAAARAAELGVLPVEMQLADSAHKASLK